MQTLQNGYSGLSLLVNLNLDRLMFLSAIGGALLAGSFLASL